MKTPRLSRLPLCGGSFPPPPPTEKNAPGSCFLVSCGIEHADRAPRYCWDNRTRGNFCLLQYTIDGEGLFDDLAVGTTRTLPPGSAFLIPAPSRTRYRLPEGGRWKLAYALFSGVTAFHHCRQVNEESGYVLNLNDAPAVLKGLAEINALRPAAGAPDFYQTSALVYRLLMALRQFSSRQAVLAPDSAGRMEPALRMIEEEYGDSSLGVEDLAEACGYSRYHFSRLFRQATGLSPQAYLIKTRLKHALRLLSSGTLPPKQVAPVCGIQDYAYFCLLFKRHYGLTPGSVRRGAFGHSSS